MKLLILTAFMVSCVWANASDEQPQRKPAGNARSSTGATLDRDNIGNTILSTLVINPKTVCYFLSESAGGVSVPVCMVDGKLVIGNH